MNRSTSPSCLASVLNDYETTIFEPAWSAWPDLTAVAPQHHQGTWLGVDRLALRQAVLELAREHEESVQATAREAHLALPTSSGITDASTDGALLVNRPWILTGHQLSVFHSGITCKYAATEAYAREQYGLSFAIIMDADLGDPGQFAIPQAEHGTPELAEDRVLREIPWGGIAVHTLATSPGLLGAGRVLDHSSLELLWREVTHGLLANGCTEAAANAARIVDDYLALAGCRIEHAHSIVMRRHLSHLPSYEVSFTRWMRHPLMQRAWQTLLDDAERLVASYNRSLDAWREARAIRNTANPFPNLQQREERSELPFWLVHDEASRREPAFISRSGETSTLWAGDQAIASQSDTPRSFTDQLAQQRWQLLPRGALVSTVFRLSVADLFVHGLGGQTYDRFTDEWIRDYFQTSPPPWTVVSGSRYLFPTGRQLVRAGEAIEQQRRDIIHHPERFIDSGWFPSETAAAIRELLSQRQQLVAGLKEARAAQHSAASEGEQLEALTRQTRQLVDSVLQPQLDRFSKLTPGQRQVIDCRTFPWFFFTSSSTQAKSASNSRDTIIA